MDHADDGDAVLRSLGEDLARDDPRLAALLDGSAPVPPRRTGRITLVLLLTTPLVTLALLLAPTVTVGSLAILLAVAAPLAVCWLCAEDRQPPRLG